MPQNLDCAKDLNLALKHIEVASHMLASTFLEKYKGCHERHTICPYRGEDCAVQDVIDGFCSDQREAGAQKTA